MTIRKITESVHRIDPLLLKGESPFRDQLLVAMPTLQDGFFTKSVIYICAHSPAGAMGIVINQRLPDVGFRELLGQLKLPYTKLAVEPVVHFGGPVESGRGFVLHSTDFMRDDTVRINDHTCITGTVDILRAMAEGKGPSKSLFALGYAGWGAGQLEMEMQENSWLVVPADDEVLYRMPLDEKWAAAFSRIGVDPLTLAPEAGHA